MLIFREVVENKKGDYRLNKRQCGDSFNYVHEALYDGICFITVTEEKLNIK